MATNGRNGGEKTGGRGKGTPNKLGLTVKENIWNTFVELQKDKKNNLLAFAKKFPKEFYLISAKLIPTEMSVSVKKLGKDLEDEQYTDK